MVLVTEECDLVLSGTNYLSNGTVQIIVSYSYKVIIVFNLCSGFTKWGNSYYWR